MPLAHLNFFDFFFRKPGVGLLGFFIFPLGFILLRKRFAIPRVFYLRPNSARKCIDRLKNR